MAMYLASAHKIGGGGGGGVGGGGGGGGGGGLSYIQCKEYNFSNRTVKMLMTIR